MFMQVSQTFQRRKSDANKQDFENKLNLAYQAQSNPKTVGILTKVFCTSGPHFVVLAWTGEELSHGQAQNGVNFDFEVKFDLAGQSQSPHKTIDILTKVFYIYGPNLVILAETGDELSRGQARDWRTDGHTRRQTQATTIPEGQNWSRVKTLQDRGPRLRMKIIQSLFVSLLFFPKPVAYTITRWTLSTLLRGMFKVKKNENLIIFDVW